MHNRGLSDEEFPGGLGPLPLKKESCPPRAMEQASVGVYSPRAARL